MCLGRARSRGGLLGTVWRLGVGQDLVDLVIMESQSPGKGMTLPRARGLEGDTRVGLVC